MRRTSRFITLVILNIVIFMYERLFNKIVNTVSHNSVFIATRFNKDYYYLGTVIVSDNAPVKAVTVLLLYGCGTNEESALYILKSQC